MNLASCSSTCFALGPGNCISRRGNFVSVAAIISSSLVKRLAVDVDEWTARAAERAYTYPVERVLAGRRKLNLRRRGLAVDRPGRKFEGTGGDCGLAFAFPADAAVPIIFKDYTTCRR